MVCRWKLAHITADLGDHDFCCRPADAGDPRQAFDGITKRADGSLDPGIERLDGGFDLCDGLEMLANQKAVMITNAAIERCQQRLARG